MRKQSSLDDSREQLTDNNTASKPKSILKGRDASVVARRSILKNTADKPPRLEEELEQENNNTGTSPAAAATAKPASKKPSLTRALSSVGSRASAAVSPSKAAGKPPMVKKPRRGEREVLLTPQMLRQGGEEVKPLTSSETVKPKNFMKKLFLMQ